MARGSSQRATPDTDLLEDFESLVRAHIRAVRRFVTSRVGPSSSDDIVSETFLAAWRRRQLHPHATIDRAWLLGVAVNQCRMAARSDRSWHERLAQRQREVERAPELEQGVIDRLDAEGRGPELLKAFAGLSEVERDVIAMAAWVGMSPAEIADALSMPAGTVRSHLHRARKALVETVAKQGVPQ